MRQTQDSPHPRQGTLKTRRHAARGLRYVQYVRYVPLRHATRDTPYLPISLKLLHFELCVGKVVGGGLVLGTQVAYREVQIGVGSLAPLQPRHL